MLFFNLIILLVELSFSLKHLESGNNSSAALHLVLTFCFAILVFRGITKGKSNTDET